MNIVNKIIINMYYNIYYNEEYNIYLNMYIIEAGSIHYLFVSTFILSSEL